jgi:hypothetical protein
LIQKIHCQDAASAISTPMLGASAEAALAAVNTARPIIIRRRRPNRSPSAAPVSSSTAKVSVYALTVHSRPSRPACSAWRITGSAFVNRMPASPGTPLIQR